MFQSPIIYFYFRDLTCNQKPAVPHSSENICNLIEYHKWMSVVLSVKLNDGHNLLHSAHYKHIKHKIQVISRNILLN